MQYFFFIVITSNVSTLSAIRADFKDDVEQGKLRQGLVYKYGNSACNISLVNLSRSCWGNPGGRVTPEKTSRIGTNKMLQAGLPSRQRQITA